MEKNVILLFFAEKEGQSVALSVARKDGPATQLSRLINIKALDKAHNANYNAARKINLPLEAK